MTASYIILRTSGMTADACIVSKNLRKHGFSSYHVAHYANMSVEELVGDLRSTLSELKNKPHLLWLAEPGWTHNLAAVRRKLAAMHVCFETILEANIVDFGVSHPDNYQFLWSEDILGVTTFSSIKTLVTDTIFPLIQNKDDTPFLSFKDYKIATALGL